MTPMRKLTRLERAILAANSGHYHAISSLADAGGDEDLLVEFDCNMDNSQIAFQVPEDTPEITGYADASFLNRITEADMAIRKAAIDAFWNPQ